MFNSLKGPLKIDWSKQYKALFQLLIGGAKTKLSEHCGQTNHCGQTDHQSPFCPTQISVLSNGKKFNERTRTNTLQQMLMEGRRCSINVW